MLAKSLAAAAVIGAAAAENFIVVQVGAGPNGPGTVFSPDNVQAPVGSVIQFQFMGGNHTVTQSTFDNPCLPISMINASVAGVHSSFYPTANVQGTPFWNLQINNTNPLWLYCAQGRHCQSGMTMVVNENTAANSTRSLVNHRQLAATVEQAAVPNGNLAIGGNGGQNVADPNDPNANPDQNQDAAGAAAGLRVPTALVAAVLAGAAYFL